MTTKIDLFLVLTAVLWNSFAPQAVAQSTGQRKPNIVYILADDLGYGDLGVYGQQKIETPNIDALAREGRRFTQHYTCPVCAPSRYTIMTGKHSGHAFIRANDEWAERGDVWDFRAMEANPTLEGQLPIPDSTITIAKILKKAGYRTALIGKWGLGAPMTTGVPNRQGFDYFFGFICQRQDHTYYPAHLWENEYRIPLNNTVASPDTKFPSGPDPLDPGNYVVYQQKDYAPDLLLDAALRFIDANSTRPFFMYYASPLPHLSLQAPQKWIDYYHKKFGDEKPFLGGGYFPCRYPHATYAAMISALDEQVGLIVKKLKTSGLYKNTIIVFCSDNGPDSGGGTDAPWFDSGGPFKSERGWGKASVHEAGIRLPFIVEWPGKIKPGTVTDLLSATWDDLPTLCEVAGVQSPPDIDGISYLPALLDLPHQRRHEFLYWEYPELDGQQAVRMGKWKAVRLHIREGNLRIQLFDLETDPQEQKDVAAGHPDIVAKMESIMKHEHSAPEVDAFRLDALEKK